MRFTITHQGVPIGRIELEPRPELTAGTVEPLPGYAAIQPIVRAASMTIQMHSISCP